MHKAYRFGLLIFVSIVVWVTARQNLPAHFYLNAGFVDLSRAAFAAPGQAAATHSQRAEQWFEQAARHTATYQSAMRGLGLSLLARGEQTSAVAVWQEAHIPASFLLDFGKNMLEQKRKDQAQTWYECAAQLDLALSANALAGLLYEQKNYTGAIQVWRQALDSFPEHPQRLSWWQGLTRSLRASEQWADARQAHEAALSEFPDDPVLLTGMGITLYYSGESSEVAADVIRRSIALDSSLAESYAALAQIMANEKQYEQAYLWYSEAIARDPRVRYWHVARGNMARAAGELSLALEAYQQGIELYPDHAPFYYEMSWAYYLNKEPDRAVSAIEQALALASTPTLNYYLRAGQIYERVGLSEKALGIYQKAFELAPDNQSVKDALQRLKSK